MLTRFLVCPHHSEIYMHPYLALFNATWPLLQLIAAFGPTRSAVVWVFIASVLSQVLTVYLLMSYARSRALRAHYDIPVLLFYALFLILYDIAFILSQNGTATLGVKGTAIFYLVLDCLVWGPYFYCVIRLCQNYDVVKGEATTTTVYTEQQQQKDLSSPSYDMESPAPIPSELFERGGGGGGGVKGNTIFDGGDW